MCPAPGSREPPPYRPIHHPIPILDSSNMAIRRCTPSGTFPRRRHPSDISHGRSRLFGYLPLCTRAIVGPAPPSPLIAAQPRPPISAGKAGLYILIPACHGQGVSSLVIPTAFTTLLIWRPPFIHADAPAPTPSVQSAGRPSPAY